MFGSFGISVATLTEVGIDGMTLRAYGTRRESVWNRGDPTLIDELIVPDYIQHAQGVVKQFFAALRPAIPEIHNTIEDMIAEGDKVVWRSAIRGTHSGPFRGSRPPASR